MSVEQRIAALEAAFEEVKRLKGIAGPRGQQDQSTPQLITRDTLPRKQV